MTEHHDLAHDLAPRFLKNTCAFLIVFRCTCRFNVFLRFLFGVFVSANFFSESFFFESFILSVLFYEFFLMVSFLIVFLL